MLLRSSLMRVPTFPISVGNVVSLSPKEEVRVVDTSRVVAAVQYEGANDPIDQLRDTPVGQEPRDAMHVRMASAEADLTVSTVIDAADPLPAWTKLRANDGSILVDTRPERRQEPFVGGVVQFGDRSTFSSSAHHAAFFARARERRAR